MPHFSPAQLAQWTDGRWTVEPAAAPTGFAIDTRQLTRGSVFVALRTDRRDGHDFLAEAHRAGASAALVSAPRPDCPLPQLVVTDPLRAFQEIARHHRRLFAGPVVGITGSAGKTSTKNLLAAALGAATLATEGNLNNYLGVPLTLTRLDPAQHRFAVIEAGISEPGEMEELARMIEPDVALITLIGAAHTETLGGLEGVAREKGRLAAAVRPGGVAILPRSVADHAAIEALPVAKAVVERVDMLTSGVHPPGVVRYTVSHDAGGTTVALAGSGSDRETYTLRRTSQGMAQNAVLAVVAARRLGVDAAAVQHGLAGWAPAPLRGEIREEGGRLWYLDCYNANPASMRDALQAFGSLTAGGRARVYVLGGMEELGPESRRHHQEVGAALRLAAADRVYVIGPEAAAVRDGAIASGADPAQIEPVSSLEPVARALANFEGAIFVKGSRKYRLEELLTQLPRSRPGAS